LIVLHDSTHCARLFAIVLLGLGALLSGCTATRVTLLPDHSGHVGAVTVFNTKGEQRIDQAFSTVAINSLSSAVGEAHAIDRQQFENAHRALIDAQPTPPRSFVLNFLFDSVELTAESRKILPEVMQVVRDRSPTEVAVFGYADSSGTAQHNLTLSAERARAVAKLLKQIDPKLPIEVQYFGETLPLAPSPPGVPEPRNRRAEIFIL
jgi:outer membrane protein OmpA-like peptidoglycan-associated protein